ncbi:tail protein X [Pectobacterium odoriferum]|uniref:tail protein X n=1 Tax=Pectobacterium odoriferum TaxID=78398 RepID=UPI00052A386B|nr:tail protein X [Pectobacterium odoriferum]AIU88989.1 tail protein X [Pectobacterium odoriferum]POE18641.1 phage tail protein [Pectobacterium odoriferum]POE35512.1 phage tail protein [Pectobacterium odoriferum]
MEVRAQQNDTVDLLCWRYYGRTDGVTEGVYAANLGLCERGPLLPAGLLVTLPDVTAATQQEIIQLWD